MINTQESNKYPPYILIFLMSLVMYLVSKIFPGKKIYIVILAVPMFVLYIKVFGVPGPKHGPKPKNPCEEKEEEKKEKKKCEIVEDEEKDEENIEETTVVMGKVKNAMVKTSAIIKMKSKGKVAIDMKKVLHKLLDKFEEVVENVMTKNKIDEREMLNDDHWRAVSSAFSFVEVFKLLPKNATLLTVHNFHFLLNDALKSNTVLDKPLETISVENVERFHTLKKKVGMDKENDTLHYTEVRVILEKNEREKVIELLKKYENYFVWLVLMYWTVHGRDLYDSCLSEYGVKLLEEMD